MYVLFALPAYSKAQQVWLSEDAKVSVITFGPSQDEVYSAFGHSAIRIYDPVRRIDNAYNYGVFDFSQPNFYLNYTKGRPLFKLGVSSYPQMKEVYLYYNRWVHEQELNLNAEQIQKVFDYLQWNALPENRNYVYDYFYDNCATKIRDIFSEVLSGDIRFDDSFLNTSYTIRQLTDIYLAQQPWGDLGIDICLGLPMDKKISPYQYMFIPDYIELFFAHASIKKGDSLIPLVSNTVVTNPSNPQEVNHAAPHPWIVFGAVLLVVSGISYRDYKKQKISRWLDVGLLAITGLLGWLLFLLWVATDHKAAAGNLNLLWALPTNAFAIAMLFGKQKEWIKKYYGFAAILTLLLLVTWPFLPQQINVFLIPLVIALLIRYVLNYYLLTGHMQNQR